MIEKHDDFNKEIERLSQLILDKGHCEFNVEEFSEEITKINI